MTNSITHQPNTPFRATPLAGALSPTRLLLLLLGMMLLAAPARAQSFAWAKKTTNTAGKTSVVTDQNGNTYVLADFTGTVSVGNYTFTSYGASDILLVKYNAAGTVQWARRMGGKGNEEAGDLDMAQNGEFLFITGSFQATIGFGTYHVGDVSPLTSASLNKSDVFVAKYYLGGALDWARRAGGTGDDFGRGIEVTADNEVYVTGAFRETMSFKIGLNTVSVKSSGLSDVFLLHYNALGSVQQVRRIGGTGLDYGSAVAWDKPTGNVYLTGGYSPAGSSIPNVLVARYDDNGILQYNQQYGSAGMLDTGNDITVDLEGVHVTGYFGGTINFDGKSLTSSGTADAFVINYAGKTSNAVTWAKKYGGASWDEGQSLAYRFGRLYLGGSFKGTVTFGTTALTAKGGATDRDMFLASLAADGTPLWTQQIGSTSSDYGRGAISLYYENSIFFTGHYGSAIALGNSQLAGSGNLLTKISLPVLNDISLINAPTDAVISTTLAPTTINYLVIGTDKINFRANVAPGTVGSVKFVLDGVTRIENGAPFSWAGDQKKLDGSTDYLGFTPSLGKHQLLATPYSGPNGTGAAGVTRNFVFTITNQPQVKGVTIIAAESDLDMFPLEAIATVIYSEVGTNQIGFRANTNFTSMGSVKFVLDNGAPKIENVAPYSLGGDAPKPGGIDYKAVPLSHGPHTLVVTAYSGPNATGTASTVYSHHFFISYDGRRVAAETPGAEAQASFRAAPNPFDGRTRLTYTATEDAPATVDVYNAQGVPVARLFEGTVQTGKSYEWAFDGTAQAPGLYVARLKVGQQLLHQRLVRNK